MLQNRRFGCHQSCHSRHLLLFSDLVGECGFHLALVAAVPGAADGVAIAKPRNSRRARRPSAIVVIVEAPVVAIVTMPSVVESWSFHRGQQMNQPAVFLHY